jgi:hypothetical protein
MSRTSDRTSTGSAKRATSLRVSWMSPNQLRAYFVARETLRKLKPIPTPLVPADFPPRDRGHVGR